ncbi:hypothetical protein Btru_063450, partial [Bulinus truncatus]
MNAMCACVGVRIVKKKTTTVNDMRNGCSGSFIEPLVDIASGKIHQAPEDVTTAYILITLKALNTVIALLRAGCDVSLVDNEGLTAAELADKCGQTEAASLIRGEITADQALARKNSPRPPSIPHLSFPPPPPFPPENAESGTNTHSSRSGSPPLPPPPTSPPFSTPPTTGSTISPPTPLSEAEDEITVLDSSFGLSRRQSGKDIGAARETIKRTPSQMSVDSTASNFGIFEHQQGPIVHIVKADVHHTPRHILTDSHPTSSTGSRSSNTSRVGPMSSSGSGTSLTQSSSGVGNGSLREETVTSYTRPGVVNIYSKQGRTTSIKSKPQTRPAPASHPESGSSNQSLNSSSTQGQTPPSATGSSTSLSSSGSLSLTQEDSSSEKKPKKSYYTTQYRQDFNTVSKTKFAQVKSLFQLGVTDPIYICPDSGEVCSKEEHQSYAGKQTPGQHSSKMSHQDADQVPPPPHALEKSEHPLPNGGTAVPNGGSKSVVNIHGGHVTIISTGGKSDDVINGTLANKSAPRPVSGVKAASNGNSDNVSALMKELSLRRPASPINGNVTPTTQPLPNGDASNHSGHNALSRPVSVHTSVGVANELSDKSKIYSRSSSSSSASSQPHSPVAMTNKHNLIADIQSAVSGSSNLSLRRAKSRGEGVSMVYQSKKSAAASGDVQNDHRPLSGQFDPKNFLDQVEKVDSSGLVIPEWRRQVLAKHAAEKAQKEYEERKLVEDYEERFKNVPAWKRAIIEKKEAQAREEAAALK